MAITRTQQAKQMLQDGGMLVKPSTDGRRPGYRSAAFQSARSRSMSSGRSKSTGPSFNDVSRASDDDRRQTYSAVQTQTGKVKGGGKGIGTDKRGNVVFEDDRPSKTAIDNARKFQEEQKQKREETIKKSRSFNPFPIATSVLDKISNSKLAKYNNLLQRNNYFRTLNTDQQVALLEALAKEEEIGTLNPMGITRNIDRGLEEGILGIGGGKFITDIDFGGKDAKEVINKTIEQYNKDLAEGKLDKNASVVLGDDQPALTYDEYLENQMTRFDPGPSDDPTDPCLGPNPPAYCATRNTDPTTPPPPRQILTSRIIGSQFEPTMFAADGGIMNNDIVGGMMDGNMDEMGRQMYGLGKLVKKATRAVKKIVKSPIGKAALIGAGFGLAGMGPFSALKGSSLGKFLVGTGLPTGPRGPANTGLLGKLLLKKGASGFSLANLSPMKTLGIVSALPLLFGTGEEEEEQDPYRGPSIDIPRIRNNPYAFMAPRFEGSQFAADGGRIGYDTAGAVMSEEDMKKLAKSPLYKGFKIMYGIDPQQAKENPSYEGKFDLFKKMYDKKFQKGGDVEPVAKKTMPLIDMDGMEKDYRETGGFVEMGRMERADDVPARLSKNEFVFTADAVRNAGDGNIDKGAEVMYNMMKNLEAGGEVSEESQGLEGARKMFQTSQRLGEVI